MLAHDRENQKRDNRPITAENSDDERANQNHGHNGDGDGQESGNSVGEGRGLFHFNAWGRELSG